MSSTRKIAAAALVVVTGGFAAVHRGSPAKSVS